MAKTVKMFEVALTIVPVQGKATTTTVSVPSSATVAEVAKVVGIKLDKKNILVDGKPASADTRVTSRSKISVSERPRGS